MLFLIAVDFTFPTRYAHNWALSHFGTATPSFLELFVIVLHCSPVVYWASSDLRCSSSSVITFCLFILSMGFSRQEHWKWLPFPSPGDHVLSDSSLRTVCFLWPCTVWLGASASDMSPFSMANCDTWRDNNYIPINSYFKYKWLNASFKDGMFQENSIETCILSRVKQITSPGWMHETSSRTWCTGKT